MATMMDTNRPELDQGIPVPSSHPPSISGPARTSTIFSQSSGVSFQLTAPIRGICPNCKEENNKISVLRFSRRNNFSNHIKCDECRGTWIKIGGHRRPRSRPRQRMSTSTSQSASSYPSSSIARPETGRNEFKSALGSAIASSTHVVNSLGRPDTHVSSPSPLSRPLSSQSTSESEPEAVPAANNNEARASGSASRAGPTTHSSLQRAEATGLRAQRRRMRETWHGVRRMVARLPARVHSILNGASTNSTGTSDGVELQDRHAYRNNGKQPLDTPDIDDEASHSPYLPPNPHQPLPGSSNFGSEGPQPPDLQHRCDCLGGCHCSVAASASVTEHSIPSAPIRPSPFSMSDILAGTGCHLTVPEHHNPHIRRSMQSSSTMSSDILDYLQPPISTPPSEADHTQQARAISVITNGHAHSHESGDPDSAIQDMGIRTPHTPRSSHSQDRGQRFG